MKTIVAGVDFSVNSNGAVDWAEQIAWAHGGRLLLVHAFPPALPADAAAEFLQLPEGALEREEKYVRKRLDGEAAKRRASGGEVDTRLETGPASETVLSIAHAEDADLLVVGTRGQTGLRRTFLGSVAARLVRDATCPVLVVPPGDDGKHRPIYRLLIPTDFSHDAHLAVDAAVRLLGPISAETHLTLLHVWRVPLILSPWSDLPMSELKAKTRASALRRLEEIAAPLRSEGYSVDIREASGEPATEIDRLAGEISADIIAMGTHGQSRLSQLLLGSVAERTIPSAPCPVLTAHAER